MMNYFSGRYLGSGYLSGNMLSNSKPAVTGKPTFFAGKYFTGNYLYGNYLKISKPTTANTSPPTIQVSSNWFKYW
jgi:hypothetical protein